MDCVFIGYIPDHESGSGIITNVIRVDLEYITVIIFNFISHYVLRICHYGLTQILV